MEQTLVEAESYDMWVKWSFSFSWSLTLVVLVFLTISTFQLSFKYSMGTQKFLLHRVFGLMQASPIFVGKKKFFACMIVCLWARACSVLTAFFLFVFLLCVKETWLFILKKKHDYDSIRRQTSIYNMTAAEHTWPVHIKPS